MFNTSWSCDCQRMFKTWLGRLIHTRVRHGFWGTGAYFGAKWEAEWGDLARYNADVNRGLVHPQEYAERMAEKQALYNEQLGYASGPGGLPITLAPGETTTLHFELELTDPQETSRHHNGAEPS